MARSVYVVGPASALAEGLGASVGSVFASLRDSAESRRRREEHLEFIENLAEKITRAQDKETAEHVLDRLEASGYAEDFSIVGEIQAFQRKRLYDFAINTVSEAFADALIDRMRKFASVEYEASMDEIFERTLSETGYEGDKSQEVVRLMADFPRYLNEKAQERKVAFEDAALVKEHKISGRIVSEFSDGRFELKTVTGAVKRFSSMREVKGYIS